MSTCIKQLYEKIVATTRLDAQRLPELFRENVEPAIQGADQSQYYLGNYYYENCNEMASASVWLALAAAQGHSGAYCQLGKIYAKVHLENRVRCAFTLENGQYITPEEALLKAIDCLKRSSEKGYAVAQYELGQLYQNLTIKWNLVTHGIIISPQEVFDLLLAAAEQSHIEAQYALGRLYQYEFGGIKLYGSEISLPDKQKAFEYYLKAAEQGHANAAYAVGSIYEHSRYDDYLRTPDNKLIHAPDLGKAILYYEKAALAGSVDAQRALDRLKQVEEVEQAATQVIEAASEISGLRSKVAGFEARFATQTDTINSLQTEIQRLHAINAQKTTEVQKLEDALKLKTTEEEKLSAEAKRLNDRITEQSSMLYTQNKMLLQYQQFMQQKQLETPQKDEVPRLPAFSSLEGRVPSAMSIDASKPVDTGTLKSPNKETSHVLGASSKESPKKRKLDLSN